MCIVHRVYNHIDILSKDIHSKAKFLFIQIKTIDSDLGGGIYNVIEGNGYYTFSQTKKCLYCCVSQQKF